MIEQIKYNLPEILKDGGIYFDPNNDYQLAYQIEKFIKNSLEFFFIPLFFTENNFFCCCF